MRIVHVVHCLDVGGQERLILSLSRALVSRGHEVHVVSLTPNGALRAEFGAIRVHDVPRRPGVDLLIVPRLAALFRRLRADVVHTHNPSPFFPAVPAARLAGVRRVVHTKHGANIYGPRALWASRVLVRGLSALVAVSKETAETARTKERAPERLLHVVPNGIPLADFGPNVEARARIRRELGIPDEAFVVGTVGRLAVEKDYPLLVRAMAPLLGEGVRLVLVGEGAARRDIEAAIDERIRPYVVLTGARRDVPDLLASFDVFSLTSKTEGLPLAVPEAMTCALPVVATAVGGLPSIVPEDTGMLVPYGDAQGLTRAFDRLRGDAELRRAMGERARAYALATFSLESMTDAYEALYQ
jgi:glycosyltransferase involved in cell wall biosynthesis